MRTLLLTNTNMKFVRYTILLLAVCSLLLVSGCSDFDDLNASDSGILIEQLLPSDSWLVISVTTKDAEQREQFNEFASKFSDGEDFWAQVEVGFAEMGMDYEEDIKPILGEEGFRFVMAYATSGNFVAMTVADVEKTQGWLDSMADLGEVEVLALGDEDMYVTTVTEEEESYTMLIEDVLMVAGDSASLLNAKGQLAADGAESLLKNKQYMDSVEEIETPYVGYAYVDFDKFEELSGGEFGLGSVLGLSSYLMDSQIWAMAFDEGDVVLSGFGDGDRELIDDLDLGFSDLEGDGIYLAESVPGDGLIFYSESGSFASMLKLWITRNGGNVEEAYASIDEYTTGYLSLDFEDKVLNFLDKGYAFAVHDNGSAEIPGMSVIIDVSSDTESANELITMLDAQIGSLVLMMQYDGTGSWDSLVKTDTEILGGEFHVVSVGLSAFGGALDTYMGVAESGSGSVASDEVLTVLYGITDDDVLVISTYDAWEVFDGEESIMDLPDFEGMFEEVKSHDDTLMYVDFSGVVGYLDLLEMGAGEESVLVEQAEGMGLEDYLEMLDGAMFGVKAGRYKVWMRGVVR